MIRLSVFYPRTEGATFDHDYYRDKHVPLAQKAWGVERAEIDKGIDGPYVAAVHFFFESMDAVGAAMGKPGTADVMADVANYTSITAVLQTSESSADEFRFSVRWEGSLGGSGPRARSRHARAERTPPGPAPPAEHRVGARRRDGGDAGRTRTGADCPRQ